MINNSEHNCIIVVNGEILELEKDLSIRINNVIFKPEENKTTSGEYSFSFDIPSTPNNDRLFDFANVLSKPNKFNKRFDCEVYADETLIFEGSLSLKQYDHSKNVYKANLVSYKVNSIDEIFGDAVLSDIPWDVDFQGASTINSINESNTEKYFFPLVAQGVFQKKPYLSDEVGNEYTSKFDIDKYNKFWVESFYPSLAPIELISRALKWKGYNVGGTAIVDPIISRTFMSCNLADEQIPIYNLGNARFGKIEISSVWNNFAASNGYYVQDLKFPYYHIGVANDAPFNFSSIDVWNMYNSSSNTGAVITDISEQYLFDPDESLIVIPADGFYRITLRVNANLSGADSTFVATQQVARSTASELGGVEYVDSAITITNNFREDTPLEIQLVRNNNDSIELIKGRKNVRYQNGNSADSSQRLEWETDYPHQALFGSPNPTDGNSTTSNAVASSDSAATTRANVDSNGRTGGRIEGGSTTPSSEGGQRRMGGERVLGYMHENGRVMPYDTNVSNSFICGFSTMGDGTVAVMKNGKSWYKGNADKNSVMADVDGMQYVTTSGGVKTVSATSMNYNYLISSPQNTCTVSHNYLSGQVHLIMYLKRNDILELVAIQRDYNGVRYRCSASTYLCIEAVSPEKRLEVVRSKHIGYYTESEFPYNLKLTNFVSNETKISEFINDFTNAFNLDIVQYGKNIDINLNKGIKKDLYSYIDVDDRVSKYEAVSSSIDYPKEMGATFNVNTDEYGYEFSVPSEWINTDEWDTKGDFGSSLIQLSTDDYNTKKDVTNTKFSYCWWVPFTLKNDSDSVIGYIDVPVIELSEYMADGYGYDEAMKHDGYGLTKRFWFKSYPTSHRLKLSSWMDEYVNITLPVRTMDNFALSYYPTEKSILTEYYNTHPLLGSNYVEVDVHITPEEYKRLKNGSMVKFSDDLYYISEIGGFDTSGRNRTTLKIVKR